MYYQIISYHIIYKFYLCRDQGFVSCYPVVELRPSLLRLLSLFPKALKFGLYIDVMCIGPILKHSHEQETRLSGTQITSYVHQTASCSLKPLVTTEMLDHRYRVKII